MNNTTTNDITGSNLYSIKDKLIMFEEKTISLKNDFGVHLNQTIEFQNELVDLNRKSSNTPVVIHKDILGDCNEKEELINGHIIQQKSENLRINRDLGDLRNSTDEFRASLEQCLIKLKELERKIGVEIQA